MQSSEPSLKAEMVSHATVTRLARKLAHQVQDSGFKPDMIICIARGGYIPARLLCDFLNIHALSSIRIKHYTESNKTEKAELIDPLAIDISGKNILLVDDLDDSGETLKLAQDYLKGLHQKQVRVAVLHHKATSSFSPDYFAKEIIHWHWITYPWAMVEDVLALVKKMQPLPSSVAEATDCMAKEYDFKVPKTVMQDVFRLLK